MGFIKYTADRIFNGYEYEKDNKVLVINDNGTIETLLPASEAGEGVQKLEGIISPGFINAHCHLELSHLKGLIPMHTGLVDFVFKVVTERHFADEEIFKSIQNAEAQMIRNGIMAVGDICNNLLTFSQKQKRNIHYFNFIEVSGWLPPVAEIRFKKSFDIYSAFHKYFSNSSLVPHAPYSVSEDLWRLLIPNFQNNIVTIHNQETKDENQYFINGTGDLNRMYQLMKMDTSFFEPYGHNSLYTYFSKFKEGRNIILVHNTFTEIKDVQLVNHSKRADQAVFFCICINANLYIENTIPPVQLLRDNNCNLVLGTDSLASNHQLDLLEEMKTIQKYYPAIPTSEMLKWATINGARALGFENQLGSFEKNKTPGVLLIDNIVKGDITPSSTVRKIK